MTSRIVLILSLLGSAYGSGHTSAPTAAPTSVPTSSPTSPTSAPTSTPTSAPVPAAPTSAPVPAAVPQVVVSFGLAFEAGTTTCADYAKPSPGYNVIADVGSKIAGTVAMDAVKLGCGGDAAARRLGERRLAPLDFAFEVTVPQTQSATVESSVNSVTVSDVAGYITAATAAETGFTETLTVDAASLTAMKSSLAVTAVTAAPTAAPAVDSAGAGAGPGPGPAPEPPPAGGAVKASGVSALALLLAAALASGEA